MVIRITINNYLQLFTLIRKIYQKNLLEDDLNLLKGFEFYIPKSDQNGMFIDDVLSYEISTTIKNIIDKWEMPRH